MLEQKQVLELESFSQTIGVSAALLAQELEIIIRNSEGFAQGSFAQGSQDEFTPLKERLVEKEPDKYAGFALVGNDTWLPKHLVNDRRHQQRKLSRMTKNGIGWTRK